MMSQPQSSTDTQVLLQSMLQRLKIQQERDTQAFSHAALPAGAPSATGPAGEGDSAGIQSVSSSPVNGFGFYNDTSPKDLRTFGVGRNCSPPDQKYSTDAGTGEKDSLVQVIQPGISPTVAAGSLKDASVTLLDRVTVLDGATAEKESSTLRTSDAGQNLGQIQDQVFSPKVYSWSPKPTDERNGTGGPEHKVPVAEGFAQGQDLHAVQTDQNSANSLSRRKQRPSGNRARRWTQKIKEKWRDRPGSFGKRAKEEQREEQQTQRSTTISPQNHHLTAVVSSDQESPALPVISNHSPSPLTQGETSTQEDSLSRCSRDFDFGLGSFSLLEEIGMGQEWAMFLNPSQSAATAVQTPSNEFRIPRTSAGHNPQPVTLVGSVSGQLPFGGTGGARPLSDVAMTQAPSSDFLPDSMDVSEGKQPRVAGQAEPVAFSHGETQTQLVDRRPHQRPPPSFAQAADVQRSSLKVRDHSNRKRQHQSIEGRGREPETLEARKTDGEVGPAPLTPTGSHMMEATATPRPDGGVGPCHSVNSPPPSPASFNPLAPRKGVLKHSISHEAEASLEFVTKRRRVEENKRVHFSEKVMAISPPELDMDTDSEEESVEEDSTSSASSTREQERAEERPGGAAPARRPAFPAWILALRRRNTESKSKK